MEVARIGVITVEAPFRSPLHSPVMRFIGLLLHLLLALPCFAQWTAMNVPSTLQVSKLAISKDGHRIAAFGNMYNPELPGYTDVICSSLNDGETWSVHSSAAIIPVYMWWDNEALFQIRLNDPDALYRSDNGGASFGMVQDNLPGSGNVVLLADGSWMRGGGTFYHSTDQGVTWQHNGVEAYGSIRDAVVLGSGRIIITTPSSVAYSDDQGLSWFLSTYEFWPWTISGTRDRIEVLSNGTVVLQDDILRVSHDHGETFAAIDGATPVDMIAFGVVNDAIVAGCSDGESHISYNEGGSFMAVLNGLDMSLGGDIVSANEHVYFGGIHGLYAFDVNAEDEEEVKETSSLMVERAQIHIRMDQADEWILYGYALDGKCVWMSAGFGNDQVPLPKCKGMMLLVWQSDSSRITRKLLLE